MKIVKILLGIVGGVVVLFSVASAFLLMGSNAVKNLSIGTVDFTKLKDGIYVGQFNGRRWSNKLQVTVSSGRAVDIAVLQDVTFSRPELTQQVFNNVIQTQSLQIDTVSGATLTTKAYLKAVENAVAEAQ